MLKRPIGIFDSGLGGLTAIRQLKQVLPNENLIYFGDTGRVPYGTRSAQTIIQYALEDIQFLLSHNVKMVIAACGTISSVLPVELVEQLGIDYLGVVNPAATRACTVTKNDILGVIGTGATIKSMAYNKAIYKINPKIQVVTNSCPLLVPLVENGYIHPDNQVTKLVLQQYLQPIQNAGADTLILGCTHYPILMDSIDAIFHGDITLIDSGKTVADAAKDFLAGKNRLNPNGNGDCSYYVTDSVEGFSETAQILLGERLQEVYKVNLEEVERKR